MSARWESKLQQFQRSMEAFRQLAGLDLHYGVVHLRGNPHTPADRTERTEPLIYASGGTLVEMLTVPVTAEEYQLHLLFSDYGCKVPDGILTQFKSRLRELRNILPILPERVLPASKIRPMPSGLDEEFVRWGLALIWLADTEQTVFHNEIEYCDSAASFGTTGKVSKWENFSPLSEFDPIHFVTLTASPEKRWDYWKDEHTKAGRGFPDVLAVSLTKPIFYASLNAVHLLIQSGLEQRPKPITKRRPARITRGGTELSDADQAVLSALRKHHQGSDEGPNFNKLTQSEIAKLAGVSQESVSRTIKDHMCPFPACNGLTPRKCYATLCKDRLILAILDQIEYPLRREEITNVDLDRLSGEDH